MTSIESLTLEAPDPAAADAVLAAAFGPGTPMRARGSEAPTTGLRGLTLSLASPEGTGSHRIATDSGAGPFTDPDGFTWEAPADTDRTPDASR
jgi:hypothetical protein